MSLDELIHDLYTSNMRLDARLEELVAVQRRQAVALENLSGTLMVAGKRVSAIEDNLNDLAGCVDQDGDFRVTVNGIVDVNT